MARPSPIPNRRTSPNHLAKPAWHRPFHLIRFSLALLGLAVALSGLLLATQPQVRTSAEGRLIGWLQQRQPDAPAFAGAVAAPASQVTEGTAMEQASAPESVVAAVAVAEPLTVAAITDAVADDPARTVDLTQMPREQAKVTYWLSKKYRVAPEPLSVLVAEAWAIGQRTRIDWTLLLAMMAVESSFNPYAQSSVGAQGLMQVMTRIHTEKYSDAGGDLAAFDPLTNLRVGAQVLVECIERGGSLQAGLKYYVGAANLSSDNGYTKRVLDEQQRLKKVAAGRVVS